jgi:imidazoleglycerol phosphate synthase glutamine amidotransferase subunit HisH
MKKDATIPKPRLAVIDYGMGNLRSVVRAWESIGADAFLVSNPSQITQADALVFPGQGAIVDTMRLLQSTGFDNMIRDWIAADRPFFGICLGLQALFEHSASLRVRSNAFALISVIPRARSPTWVGIQLLSTREHH